ncbi:nucleolar GTP-binding protein 2 [Melia azedarach]|uniref:Nucleolar GTP-binding protein 2 n=1 Tax=Melia azedarach TaxID=155640 RepID=A0ACC1WTU4_MELAZ|nr:nucleolar GTP-binding protein 2 [Melia azedarach]
MKGREAKGAPSADLLVCFPSRAHLTLMPKPICSPARPSESNKRHNHHHHHSQHPKKLTSKGAGHASPLLWSKTKPTGPEIAEPTSPKVTCAGQIKVRTKASSCKSWQSVMEEIERIHNSRNKHKKRPSWTESLGFKKEIMQFLTCLRNIRFDFRCFGAFPQADITTDDEDDDDEDEEYQEKHVSVEGSDGNETSRTVFSKWFMVLQENQNNCYYKEEKNNKEKERSSVDDESVAAPAAPPPNALLLMRCRSAPAKSRFEDKAEDKENKNEDEEDDDDDHKEEEEEEEEDERKKEVKKTKNLKSLIEEEKRNNKENLVVMAYDTDFYKISSDIAKETWIVDDMKDLLSRSRSWKR